MFNIGKFVENASLKKRVLYLSRIFTSACFSCANAGFAKERPIPTEYQGLPTFNVVDLGADPSGSRDSGPAFRKAGGSNRIILIPPGTYRFKSTVKPACCAYDPEAVRYANMSNFLVTGYGATLVADDSIALSGLLAINQSHNFEVRGLSFRGSRKGLPNDKENGAFGFSSVTNFKVSDMHVGEGFEVNGSGVGGDWWVNGTIENVTMDGVGHCADVAYLQHVVFKNIKCRGKGPGGGSGMTGISFIEDPPNVNQNHTGVNFNSTYDVSIVDSELSNFNTAAYLSTGKHISFSHNHWHDNVGSSHVLGIGILIKTNAKYIGAPPQDIRINDKFYRNSIAIKVDGQNGSPDKVIKNVEFKSVFVGNKKDLSLSGDFVHNVVNAFAIHSK